MKMKWPESVALIRHDTSEYNLLKERKKHDPLYKNFLQAWDHDPGSEAARQLAQAVQAKFALGTGDAKTKLADAEGRQAYETGVALRVREKVPHVIFVSPYDRAVLTLKHITRGWPELADVKVYEEERIREQGHGLSLIYNDWRVFHTLHPKQRQLFEIEGPYWYQYPQGEDVPMVRERNRSLMGTLIREYARKRVLLVTHHLNILAIRANLERLSAEQFIELDKKDKPINCGVTMYRGNPHKGKQGHLELDYYNHRYYR